MDVEGSSAGLDIDKLIYRASPFAMESGILATGSFEPGAEVGEGAISPLALLWPIRRADEGVLGVVPRSCDRSRRARL